MDVEEEQAEGLELHKERRENSEENWGCVLTDQGSPTGPQQSWGLVMGSRKSPRSSQG